MGDRPKGLTLTYSPTLARIGNTNGSFMPYGLVMAPGGVRTGEAVCEKKNER